MAELVQYSTKIVGQNQTQKLIVPLFDTLGVPVFLVPSAALVVAMVSELAITPITVAPADWLELGQGYYILTLDGMTYFPNLGSLQLDLGVVPAIPVRYSFEVSLDSNLNDSIFYDSIRDALGNPVPNVLVEVFETGTSNLLFSVRTSTLGEFSIPLSSVAPFLIVDFRFSPIGQPTFIREKVYIG